MWYIIFWLILGIIGSVLDLFVYYDIEKNDIKLSDIINACMFAIGGLVMFILSIAVNINKLLSSKYNKVIIKHKKEK